MKKKLILSFITIIFFKSYSQIKFESGYFITNTGVKINCLIKNLDWKDNPTSFIYKLADNTNTLHNTIDSVKEFGIYNESVYRKFTVGIDRASEDIDNMSTNKEPKLKKETLFLKVMIQGKASLYYYEDGNLNRYFYSLDTSNAVQLIYKSYRVTDDVVQQNKTYKEQLWNNLQCTKVSMRDIENTEYTYNDLSRIFKTYNQVNSSVSVVVVDSSKSKRHLFNLNIRPGITSSNLSITYYDGSGSVPKYYTTSFGTKENLRLGVEAEFVLPFNKNKWAIIVEPTYESYKGTGYNAQPFGGTTYLAEYKVINLPLGLRHSFFINDNSKIFLNVCYSINNMISMGSKIQQFQITIPPNLEFKETGGLLFGAGYTYKKKFSAEVRIDSNRDILDDYDFWLSSYRNFSLILGYNIF